ncbi:hypothetical protein RR42_m1741 [Cupriavidus basilensis]|uniref:ParB/Sulfiredoxin domain-containing protein n=2 Tax=Cupriavidus basilensis TaxID=68895 RepID=A0A0C4Y850_9BURK|nr:hypothetical protein RR42_m1741 [Cupriavidus basilensis]
MAESRKSFTVRRNRPKFRERFPMTTSAAAKKTAATTRRPSPAATKVAAKSRPTAKTGRKRTSKADLPREEENKSSQGPVLDLPEGDSLEIEPSRLLLDPDNLRLLERVGETFQNLELKLYGQPSIQKKLFDVINSDPRFDIGSLAASIANNGFLKHERLIVARYDGEKFLVLEGNRRVTAVRRLLEENGPTLQKLRPTVRESLQTLPCFVLKGSVIGTSTQQLAAYRRASEIYIGMRHLMGAKSWEPASRYEFQSRLIFDEGWSASDVAERFGRKKAEVLRDLKAHVLYHDFVKFERANSIEHSLTYNAFAEAARAPVISQWLEWSADEMQYLNRENEDAFFHYLITRLRGASSSSEDTDDDLVPELSAEMAVRRLRDMLRLEDPTIVESLLDRDFKSAEILFEERKEGALPKKIASFTRTLKRTTTEDLTDSPETEARLLELHKQVTKMLSMIKALSGE